MRYTSRTEAIHREIVEVIEASGVVEDAYAEFDVDEIANEVLHTGENGYAVDEDVDFWAAVQRHADY